MAGDVILDRYWHGGTDRISPEAPVPVVHITARDERPGGAANVALNVRSLGAQVALVGLIGADPAGAALAAALAQQGVACRLTQLDDWPTIVKLRILSQHQQLIRLDFEDPGRAPEPAAIEQNFAGALAEARVVVLSDYAKGTLRDVARLIALARASNATVIVDPKGRDLSRYAGATVLTPNVRELEAVVGSCDGESAIVEKGRELCVRHDIAALLVTRGGQGMTLIQRDKDPLHLPARARDVYDVTGAGDTVCGVLAAALAAGYDLGQATALANTAAGIVVGKLGAASVSYEELEAALHETVEGRFGILDEDTLVGEVEAARRRGERIVMTNGCFDILHAAHVRYLEQARRLGDRLIVAVNADESVRSLKGAGRPVNALAERMELLAALAAVDWVVAFREETPARLICRLNPDVLVKGGDYRPEQVAGADCVKARGGEVVIVEYIPGYSSTRIIDAVNSSGAAAR